MDSLTVVMGGRYNNYERESEHLKISLPIVGLYSDNAEEVGSCSLHVGAC
jgi:hypothetical protein